MGWSVSNQAQLLERRAHGVEFEVADGAEAEAPAILNLIPSSAARP
jgi:hypothetical protein